MLLSGNGRHRRPRPTPKFVVAAGVTGAGVALPLMGAGGANAASPDTWDKVAECESGNSWSINSGNGYYGGLQMSQSTWDEYGGREYAPRPDLASRKDQIAVAEKVLAALGPAAWPSCALTAGLTTGGPAVDLPMGKSKTQTPNILKTQDPYEDEEAPEADPSGTPERSASGTPGAGPSASTSPEKWSPESQAPGRDSGERRTSPSPDSSQTIVVSETELIPEPVYVQELTGTGSNDRPASTADKDDDRTSRGTGKHRGGSEKYTVAKGDSLESIAESQDVDGGWQTLYEANKDTIGDDPNEIVPGQRLKIG